MMNQYFGAWHGPREALDPALDKVDRLFPDKMVIISEFGFPGIFAKNPTEADAMRVSIMREQMPLLAQARLDRGRDPLVLPGLQVAALFLAGPGTGISRARHRRPEPPTQAVVLRVEGAERTGTSRCALDGDSSTVRQRHSRSR